MARGLRYFANPYPDLDERELVQVGPEVWKSHALDIAIDIQKNGRTVLHSVDGGLYVGPGGIAYAFMDLASKYSDTSGEKPALLEFASQLVNTNLKYLDRADVKHDKEIKVGFLLGAPGIHAEAAVLSKMTGDNDGVRLWSERFASVADLYFPVNLHACGSDELFVGRAGYICGALWLRQQLGYDVVPLPKLHKICDSILESGRTYSRRKRSLCPLMFSYYDTEYLGAAHGLCAILQMILSVPDYSLYNPSAEMDVKTSALFLISIQTGTGNVPCAMDEALPFPARKAEDELVHWCHGAPGTVYLFAKAYLQWKEDAFLNAAIACGDCVWQRGLLKKGPGICHGVAGSGFVFLLLYRLTGDPKYLHRAHRFADFLFTPEFQTARTPDCPFSLYEGTAGTMCYLAALAEPDSAAFPFFEVFK